MIVLLSQTGPPPIHHVPPTSDLFPAKVSPNHATCHFALPRAAEGMIPLRIEKSFLHALTLFFFCYFNDPTWFFYLLNTVIRSVWVVSIKHKLAPSEWSSDSVEVSGKFPELLIWAHLRGTQIPSGNSRGTQLITAVSPSKQ